MALPISTTVLRFTSPLRLGRSMMTGPDQLRRTMHESAAAQTVESMTPTDSYKLLVVGGGTAGSTVASKFASKLATGDVGIIEPSKVSTKRVYF